MHKPATALSTVLILALLTITFTASASIPLPAPRHIFINVANDAGVKFDVDGTAYGGADNTYYIKADGGGLNEIHVTNAVSEPNGQVTVDFADTSNPSGVIWITNTGGRGFDDDIVLLLSVNGTIPNDFSVHVKTSGYTWTPSSVANQLPTDYSYVQGAVDETFTKTDFIYGPQTWKPGPGDLVIPSLPLYFGGDVGDTTNRYQLLFIDLKVGNLYPPKFPGVTLTDEGAAKLEFQFHNLESHATFNAYGWCLNANQGQGISWTNRVVDTGSSGYSVLGVTSAGAVPLPGFSNSPTDTDSDGLYEDLNANGALDFNDVQLFFRQMDWITENEPIALFDFNHNSGIDFNDIQLLFRKI